MSAFNGSFSADRWLNFGFISMQTSDIARLSLIIYLYCFHLFYQSTLTNGSLNRLKEMVYIFGVLHLIHFCFLALSVYLNDLPIIPVKVTGGALAYLMIILYPFVINKIKKLSLIHI